MSQTDVKATAHFEYQLADPNYIFRNPNQWHMPQTHNHIDIEPATSSDGEMDQAPSEMSDNPNLAGYPNRHVMRARNQRLSYAPLITFFHRERFLRPIISQPDALSAPSFRSEPTEGYRDRFEAVIRASALRFELLLNPTTKHHMWHYYFATFEEDDQRKIWRHAHSNSRIQQDIQDGCHF
jgi:hypothetical protein